MSKYFWKRKNLMLFENSGMWKCLKIAHKKNGENLNDLKVKCSRKINNWSCKLEVLDSVGREDKRQNIQKSVFLVNQWYSHETAI